MTTTAQIDNSLSDTLDRYVAQTKSMLVALSDDGQLETLGRVNTLNILWAISDRVDDIEATVGLIRTNGEAE